MQFEFFSKTSYHKGLQMFIIPHWGLMEVLYNFPDFWDDICKILIQFWFSFNIDFNIYVFKVVIFVTLFIILIDIYREKKKKFYSM